MRLFYSAASPYARIVQIALLETGLDGRVTKQEITRASALFAGSGGIGFQSASGWLRWLADAG
jgi:hypothetical protein